MKKVFVDYIKCKILIPYSKGNILSYLSQNTTIFNTKYTEEGTLLDLELSNSDYNKYKEYEVK